MRSFSRLFAFLILGTAALAEQPVYTIKLHATASFAPDSKNRDTLAFYAPRVPGLTAAYEALGYSLPVVITAKNPNLAIQEIADQVSTATGERLGKHSDSLADAAAAPNFILQAVSDRAGIVLVLVPKGGEQYSVICSYRFGAKKTGQAAEPANANGRSSP